MFKSEKKTHRITYNDGAAPLRNRSGVVPLKMHNILMKFRNIVKYTLKIRKINYGMRETEKNIHHLYFAVIVGKTDVNT